MLSTVSPQTQILKKDKAHLLRRNGFAEQSCGQRPQCELNIIRLKHRFSADTNFKERQSSFAAEKWLCGAKLRTTSAMRAEYNSA
jgi:hypothetical protein